MSGDNLNILAGQGSASLAWFAALNTALPATTVAALTSFSDAGLCTTDGLAVNVTETVNTVKAYGSTSIQRTIIQDSQRTFDVAFLETNLVTQCIYNRLALGSLTLDESGEFAYEVGGPLDQTYAGVFDIVDGENHMRACCPRLQVSAIKSLAVAAGKEIPYGVTLTALTDTDGIAVYWHVLNTNLSDES